jgi:hypothetical protein
MNVCVHVSLSLTSTIRCFGTLCDDANRRKAATQAALDETENEMREHQSLVAVGGGNVAAQVDQLAAELKQNSVSTSTFSDADPNMPAIADGNSGGDLATDTSD